MEQSAEEDRSISQAQRNKTRGRRQRSRGRLLICQSMPGVECLAGAAGRQLRRWQRRFDLRWYRGAVVSDRIANRRRSDNAVQGPLLVVARQPASVHIATV